MNDQISGGAFTVARKLFSSTIWSKDPLYIKLWLWIIGRASHSNHTKNGWERNRGEFVTTYDEIIKNLSHTHNRQRFYPTIKKIRVILRWLESENMIFVKPLKSGLGRTRADTRADTRAYVGIKIIVINYDTYQDLKSYKGRHQDGNFAEQGHNNKNGYNNVKETPAFSEMENLKNQYDQKLINQAFQAFASCRKSNKVADSVLIAQLKKWNRYPVAQVEAGIRAYLEKDYATQGKKENYLLGIIRNQQAAHQPEQASPPKTLTHQEIEELTTRNE